jgi:hypothetical protein
MTVDADDEGEPNYCLHTPALEIQKKISLIIPSNI